jgi:hypothetical protein
MGMVHHQPADGHDEDPAADDDKRVGEKLCASIGLDVVPGTLERGENVDKQQGEEEQEYQIEDDIVLARVIIRYEFAQHFSVKRIRKDTIFSFPLLRF